VNNSKGRCFAFEYPGNTHSLRISDSDWFSGDHDKPGFQIALRRDIALFQGENPTAINFP
jgi:hypothetical protein